MKKFLAVILLISVIFVSGCASTTKPPVSPENLNVSIESLAIKEFNEQDVSILVSNSAQAIDSVSVSSLIRSRLSDKLTGEYSCRQESCCQFQSYGAFV